MTCGICEKFPSPADRFLELAVSEEKKGTLFCCVERGQILEAIVGERGHRRTSVVGTIFDYEYRLPYINRINCRHCVSTIEVADALRAAPYSWPQLQAVWHKCQAGMVAATRGSAGMNGV